jgi:hypothetical protein
MEAGDDGGDTVDQLEAEPEVELQSEQRVERGQNGLLAKLRANLGADDVHVADAEVGGEEVLLERLKDRAGSDSGGIGDRIEDSGVSLVAEVNDGAGDFAVLGGSVSA